jgi:hypothetical protein
MGPRPRASGKIGYTLALEQPLAGNGFRQHPQTRSVVMHETQAQAVSTTPFRDFPAGTFPAPETTPTTGKQCGNSPWN